MPVGADRRAQVATALGRAPGRGHRRRQREGADASPLMADPRFVGGHPMAGSEQEGVDGADADLFEGAVWVLTPTPSTDDDGVRAGALDRSASLGAECVALAPDRHDALVAMVSPRAAPHRGHADAPGRRARRGASAAAAPRRRRLPGHDPDRGRPSRHLARHLRREPRRDRRRARRPDRRARRGARPSWPTATATALLDVLEPAREARLNLPARVAAPEDLVELRVTIPTGRACSARSSRWPPSST